MVVINRVIEHRFQEARDTASAIIETPANSRARLLEGRVSEMQTPARLKFQRRGADEPVFRPMLRVDAARARGYTEGG